MRARDVVGKRIVAVRHNRFHNQNTGRSMTVVSEIELHDGSVLRPFAFEGIDTPEGDIVHAKSKRRSKAKA